MGFTLCMIIIIIMISPSFHVWIKKERGEACEDRDGVREEKNVDYNDDVEKNPGTKLLLIRIESIHWQMFPIFLVLALERAPLIRKKIPETDRPRPFYPRTFFFFYFSLPYYPRRAPWNIPGGKIYSCLILRVYPSWAYHFSEKGDLSFCFAAVPFVDLDFQQI